MKVKIRVFQAREGGFWAVVPGLPGCFTQGETMEEIKHNIKEAMEGILEEEEYESESGEPSEIVELDV